MCDYEACAPEGGMPDLPIPLPITNPARYQKKFHEGSKLDIFPDTTKPHIVKDHPDGSFLVCHDGTLHWLTLHEKLMLKLGVFTIESLDAKYNGDDQRGW